MPPETDPPTDPTAAGRAPVSVRMPVLLPGAPPTVVRLRGYRKLLALGAGLGYLLLVGALETAGLPAERARALSELGALLVAAYVGVGNPAEWVSAGLAQVAASIIARRRP